MSILNKAPIDARVGVLIIVMLMVATLFGGPILTASPSTDVAASGAEQPTERAVQDAITASQSTLLSKQINDTHWSSPLSLGVDGTVDVQATMVHALTLEYFDSHEESKRDAVSFLLSERADDGGWNDSATNHGMVLLLEQIDDGNYEPVIEEIEAEIERKNHSLTDTETASVIDLQFLTRLFYFVIDDEKTKEELFPENTHMHILHALQATKAFGENGINPAESTMFDNNLGTALGVGTLVAATSDNIDEDNFVEALEQRRFSNGAWEGSFANNLAALALSQAGYDASDATIQTALDRAVTEYQTDDGKITFSRVDVTESALALRALTQSGISPENESLQRTATWLLDHRADVPKGEFSPEVPFREETGPGWGYRSYKFSEWDDTALVSSTLRPFGPDLTDESIAFLEDVQHDSGGWKTYYTEYDPLPPTERELIQAQLSDEQFAILFEAYPSPSVTGEVLDAFGQYDRSVGDHLPTKRAVEFLFETRRSNGMWRGSWGERYTYGTSKVLIGLDAVEVNMSNPEIQQAVTALKSEQNPDGGWGEESPASPDPTADLPYGSAPSTPEQTAWAIRGLLAADVDPDAPAIEQGISYLLSTQKEDGSWEASQVFGNAAYFGDNETRYSAPGATQAYVLLALADYAEAQDIELQEADSDPESWFDVRLPLALVAVLSAFIVTLLIARRRISW